MLPTAAAATTATATTSHIVLVISSITDWLVIPTVVDVIDLSGGSRKGIH